MQATRNKLPSKARYDDHMPEGTPLQQWVWLVNEWQAAVKTFDTILAREQSELAEIKAGRARLEAQQEPSVETQDKLLEKMDKVVLYSGGLVPALMSVEEAAEELWMNQAKLASSFKHASLRRLRARKRRMAKRIAAMEAHRTALRKVLKEEAPALAKACPIYIGKSGSHYYQLAFFLRDHCGGPQPPGWTRVTA